MARSDGLSQWQQTVSHQRSQLTNPQATVLARWSFGMVLAQSCGISSVAAVLAPLTDDSAGTLRQRLRAWWYTADHTAAAKRQINRQDRAVTSCFAPLRGWRRAWWPPTARRLALAMDASPLGQRFSLRCSRVI